MSDKAVDREIALECRDLHKHLGEGEMQVHVLRGVNLKLYRGEISAIVGPSGCGKSTLLYLLGLLDRQDSGSIHVMDELVPLDKDGEHTRIRGENIGFVFQFHFLLPEFSATENVMLPMRKLGRLSPKEMEFRAVGLLEEVGLGDKTHRLPSQLSGGEQQRVAVARALVLEPQVLLFDEPLSNLDAKLRRQVREEIREIQQKLGLTVVYVTHDQEEALAVSDQIVVMRNAAIAQIGSPRDLYDAPASRFVADFIGEANLLPCMIDNISGAVAEVTIEGYRHRLDANGLSTGPATMAVRPSRLDVKATEGFKAKVVKSTYVGNRMEYTLAVQSGEIFAVHEDVDNTLAIGQEITLGFFEKGPVLLPAA